MQSDLLLLKRMLLTIVTFTGIALTSQGQIPLTIDKAMEIAQENSPSLRRSYMNLERYKQNLLAQKASLKSRFSLNLNPVDYNKNRRFDNRLSQWYTNETFNTSGTFQVDQPILWTDGTISLINRFGWQDNSSIIEGDKTSNRAFSNDLYLQLTQPIFTYNKRKMELKQIEYDYENANISYALQQLNTEKSITDQFYSVYMAQSNLEISREELVNAQQSYDIIKNKVEADLAAKDELFQAELNLATARSSVDESQVNLENAKDKLKQTLGMRLDEDILVFAEVEIKPIQVNLDQAISHGLGSRLELRQREIESKELEFDMIKTKALNEFKGDVSISFGLIGDNSHLNKVYNNPTQNPRVSISFAVPIFDWGEKKARIKAQKMAQRINELEFQENKVEADLAAKDELFQAELNLATARSSVDESQVNLENAKDKLKQTLGMRLDEDILVFAEVEIKPIQVNLDQAISHGLGSRLELRQREIESKELEFDMIKTKALNEFKGDVSISFGLIGDNSHLNKVYNNPTQNPRVSISFAVPIFDWGEKKARIKAQKMAQRINELEFQEDKVDIELNIRQVWRNLENLRTQIKIAEQNVQNAQLTYDLNQTRYREGDITGMEMSQFQTQLSNKKITYTQALINYRIELLNLKILSLYDFDKNIPLVPMKDIIDKK